MGYVVNEDKPTNSARIHDESCGYYSHRRPKNPRDGGWHGPFETKNEAFAEAWATGRSDVKAAACCVTEPGILDRAKGVIGSAKQRVRRSAEVMSGADIRRFEEFTDAVTTAVVGVHRDQAELRERLADTEQLIADLQRDQARLTDTLARLEHSTRSRNRSEQSEVASPSLWAIVFGVASVVAVLVSVAAMVIAIS